MQTQYGVDVISMKKIMLDRGLEKLVDLSEASSVDRNTLSKILNGGAKPSTSVIEKLMSTLHIEPEQAGVIFFNRNLRNQ